MTCAAPCQTRAPVLIATRGELRWECFPETPAVRLHARQQTQSHPWHVPAVARTCLIQDAVASGVGALISKVGPPLRGIGPLPSVVGPLFASEAALDIVMCNGLQNPGLSDGTK